MAPKNPQIENRTKDREASFFAWDQLESLSLSVKGISIGHGFASPFGGQTGGGLARNRIVKSTGL